MQISQSRECPRRARESRRCTPGAEVCRTSEMLSWSLHAPSRGRPSIVETYKKGFPRTRSGRVHAGMRFRSSTAPTDAVFRAPCVPKAAPLKREGSLATSFISAAYTVNRRHVCITCTHGRSPASAVLIRTVDMGVQARFLRCSLAATSSLRGPWLVRGCASSSFAPSLPSVRFLSEDLHVPIPHSRAFVPKGSHSRRCRFAAHNASGTEPSICAPARGQRDGHNLANRPRPSSGR
ncbi:hypothetical protein BD413DRAFT_190435 [Trametes elegans]|nr:hypothetical protein BD413DRAFT_190435 [Trametes elegans]